jgi:hypothetical protein
MTEYPKTKLLDEWDIPIIFFDAIALIIPVRISF